MKKILIIFLTLVLVSSGLYSQNNGLHKYRRSSLYSILLVDTAQKMSYEIISSFLDLPVPDKFNDHNLSLRYVVVSKKEQKNRKLEDNVEDFIAKNQIAKRMVAKWFDRNKQDGSFDVATIMDRGAYNASVADFNEAINTVRGSALLSDAGEQLIGHSFVIVNNITYVDKEQQAQTAAAVFSALGSALGGMGGFVGSIAQSTANLAQTIAQTVAGFSVKVNTMLYRLEWNDETASAFYSQYYFDKSSLNPSKKQAFENENNLFRLQYVGSISTLSDKTVMRGLHKPEDVFRKVLARAIDKNVVALQKKFDEFKVVVPIYEVQGDKVMVQIGLKEGVSTNSRYEVFESMQDANGKITYTRKGILKPVEKKIWDNRYMAVEEAASNAGLNYTTFEVVSGSGFYPGMLVREIKYNSGM